LFFAELAVLLMSCCTQQSEVKHILKYSNNEICTRILEKYRLKTFKLLFELHGIMKYK